jgi:hypothetical protein
MALQHRLSGLMTPCIRSSGAVLRGPRLDCYCEGGRGRFVARAPSLHRSTPGFGSGFDPRCALPTRVAEPTYLVVMYGIGAELTTFCQEYAERSLR